MGLGRFFGFPSAAVIEAAANPEVTASANRIAVASPFATYPNHLNQVVWPDIMGQDFLPLTRPEALSVPAVSRARMLIAGSIAQIPLRAFAGDDLRDPQPLWIDRMDGPLSPFHRMLWTIDDLLFYGWSLWAVQRDRIGQPISMSRIPWDRWDFDTIGRIEVDGDLVADNEVMLIPGPHDGILNTASRSIRHASKLIKAAENAAANPTPTIELHQTTNAPMASEDIAALISAWSAARQGANAGVAFTNSAIEVREHGSVDAALLIDGRNAAAVDIARACGLPAAMLDATGPSASLTYETTEGRTRELIDFGLAPYLTAVSGRLSMNDVTPRGTTVAFDAEAFIGPIAKQEPKQVDDKPASVLEEPEESSDE